LARKFEAQSDRFWWATVAAAALAAATGFILAQVPQLKSHVQPWMVSALASVATGLEVVRTNAGWRKKADACYALRDTAVGLSRRLRFEIPPSASFAEVAAISKALAEAKEKYGACMHATNESRDASMRKGRPHI